MVIDGNSQGALSGLLAHHVELQVVEDFLRRGQGLGGVGEVLDLA